MSQSVWVVTCPELGWDCVVAVFDFNSITEEELLEKFPEDEYVLQDHHVCQNLAKFG